MDSLIRTHGLRKIYPMGNSTVHALDGLDLVIPQQAFLAVLGPSGSGKSTLLHLLGGLDRPTQGEIHVNGRQLGMLDENALAAYRRQDVGFIFQSFNLIPSMSALENVAFPLRFLPIKRHTRLERAAQVLEQVDLIDRAQHRPTELSGGQQQRVAIARALINNPSIILADEPTGNLDTQMGEQILQLLGVLHRTGRTVIVVSHDPRITHYATARIFLLDGRLVSENTYDAALAIVDKEKQ